MREDGRHPRIAGVVGECRVAHAHAGHVGNRVVRARREDAGGHAKVASAETSLRGGTSNEAGTGRDDDDN